jgi:hypothetical protein
LPGLKAICNKTAACKSQAADVLGKLGEQTQVFLPAGYKPIKSYKGAAASFGS